MKRLGDRSTGELLVLAITGTVCFLVLGVAITLVIGEIVRPERDTSQAASQIGDIINTMIGLLAGFLAGRTDVQSQKAKDEPPDQGHQ